ncbi:MAG: glycerate kinase type-2 family protein [Acidobacteriaceae bacterium]
MRQQWITNTSDIGFNNGRKVVLELAEAAFKAIDTEAIIKSAVVLDGKHLRIKNKKFKLSQFERIIVIGFGKASGRAAQALEEVLGDNISEGIGIGLTEMPGNFIKIYKGTHPKPSMQNIEVSQKIVEVAETISEKDLVIVLVSGGGSSLLCWPLSECRQSERLYDVFLKTGADIRELNLIRKHISQVKGGGLAKILYPATVVSLIFSDVPGNDYSLIASGPTYKDSTTLEDAQKIIEKYELGKFDLNETPKDDKFFKNVTNLPVVSNETAIAAIKERARELGLKTKVLSTQFYDEPATAAEILIKATEEAPVVIAGGEIHLVVTKKGGTGGRNMYLGMEMMSHIQSGLTFGGIASDGLDNSDSAGVILDYNTVLRAQKMRIDPIQYQNNYDGYGLFQKLGKELMYTGPTEANVSDLYVVYRG